MRALTFAASILICLVTAGPVALGSHSTVSNMSTAPPPLPWPQGTGSHDAEYNGASKDGSRVFFTTIEPIVTADRDQVADVFMRHGSTTTLISTGPRTGGTPREARWKGTSEDGTRVFFATTEALTANDTDSRDDTYEYSNGVTTLVTTGPQGGNGPFDAGVVMPIHISADGTRAFFHTAEQLVPEDTDQLGDLYERSNGATRLVTPGTTAGHAGLHNMSRDGEHLFVDLKDRMVPEDTDDENDIYELHDGVFRLVSKDPRWNVFNSSPEPFPVVAVSRTGGRALVYTSTPMTPEDNDNNSDTYEYANDVTRLLGKPVAGADTWTQPGGVSADGSRVYFFTEDRLVPDDTDAVVDTYVAQDGQTSLVSIQSFRKFENGATYAGASDNGSHVFLHANGSLWDVHDGLVTLVSTGPEDQFGRGEGMFLATSPDGSRVLFVGDGLVSDDVDDAGDIYERAAGVTSLVTPPGPEGRQGLVAQVYFKHASPDLSRVTFVTQERLLAADTDGNMDVYQAGVANTDGYPRPRAATPLRVPLVPAFAPCGDPNTRHAAPLSFDACNPPRPLSDYLTVGTPDANGEAPRSVGDMRIGVAVGDPSTPADEADLRLTLQITDVRDKTTLTDYEGELRAETMLRLTDTRNGPTGADPATVADFPLSFTAPCTATPDDAAGSACEISTTADSVVPGFTAEGARAVLKIGEVTVFDGGDDGDADTPGNTAFAWQGIFVP